MSDINEFGGIWTVEKLDILKGYLDAYTTALKKRCFNLIYIDAFAGTGEILLRSENDPDQEEFIDGSAQIAIDIEDKPFDEYIFVELDPQRCEKLEELKICYPEKGITIRNEDANYFLQNFKRNWLGTRGVLFLDPFATEVEWETIKKIASFNALDTWILFPTSAITRMLPTKGKPEEKLAKSLNRIYGDESWKNLYDEPSQMDMFGQKKEVREGDPKQLIEIYKTKLTELFGNRFLKQSRELKNSRNAPLFEFMFCAGNPKGAPIAKRIAKHLIERM